PKFREELISAAKKRHYIFADQLPPSKQDLMFLEDYKSHLELESGKTIEFRPLLPSDEFAARNFYYSLQETTVFYRFFYRRKIFTREMLQKQWAAVDYRQNMTIIGIVQRGKHKEIVAIGSYGTAEKETDVAEVAFVVKEDYQSLGLGTYLLQILEKIAKENKFKAFTATVLSENRAMLRVFEKQYPHTDIKYGYSGEIEVYMPFAEHEKNGEEEGSSRAREHTDSE
ncbi:MAG: GNAT family N-acetyltransferase, partial [Desulfosalsimonadaceae bacterium]